MAANKTVPNKRQQDQTRAAIETTRLIKRLQNFALDEEETKTNGEKASVEMDTQKLKAIEILLRKSLPDLSSVEHSGGVTMTHEEALKALG